MYEWSKGREFKVLCWFVYELVLSTMELHAIPSTLLRRGFLLACGIVDWVTSMER